MLSIPYQLPDVGLREISGRLYLDDEYLIFEVQDALAGEFDKDVQVVKVEPSALAEVRLEKGVVRDRLFVRPKKDDLLRTIPGKYGIELPLKVWRTHRRKAEQLVEEVMARVYDSSSTTSG